MSEHAEISIPALRPGDTGSISTRELRALRELSARVRDLADKVACFTTASEAAGGFVQISRRYHCLPLLLGTDGEPVLLYEVVEAVQECIDLDDLKARFPNLTYSQLYGSLAFLRKLAQFNTAGHDIDDLESEIAERDPAFHEELRRALADQERTRVLSAQQGSG
jgi:hypothetical protein